MKLKLKPLPTVIFTSVLILAILITWYQIFYQSPKIESGIIKPAMIFKKHSAQLRTVKFSADGQWLASGSVDSTVKIWKRETGELIITLKHPLGVTYLDISGDGKTIVTGCYDGIVRLWSTSGILIKEYKGHSETVWCVAFSPDGKIIASSGEDKNINLWDVVTGTIIRTLKGHTLTVWSVKFNPDGSQLASGSFDHTLKIWKVADGSMLQNIEKHSQAIVDLSYTHDGKMLATTSDDATIKLWNTADWSLIKTMEVPEHVQAVVFSPDDRQLLTGGRDKPMIGEALQEIFGDSKINKGVSMRLWDVSSGKMLQTFSEHENDVNDIDWSRNGKWIASASEDGTVRIWQK